MDFHGQTLVLLHYTTLTTECKYPINFIQTEKTFVLSLHYIKSNSFSYVNTVKLYQFKAKNSEIKPYSLCLGNILKNFALNNIKKQDEKVKGLKVNRIKRVKVFSVDYNAIDTSNILDICRYLIKETYYKTMFGFINTNVCCLIK